MPTASTASADSERPPAERPAGPCAFASTEPLSLAQMLAAPLRRPRPSRLREPVQVRGPKMAKGLAALGVSTVGDLLEHLPRQMRAARTIDALKVGEQATVAVVVRSIRRKPVRRRQGRRITLVQASVADETGTMTATFFNQPWLVERYPEGTRLLLRGTMRPRRGFAVSDHALAAETGGHRADCDGESGVAHYPATEGVTSTQILTLLQERRGALQEVVEPLPAIVRARQGLPDRAAALAAMHFPSGPDEHEQGRRRLAFDELLIGQLALQRRRALHASATAPSLAGPPQLSRRWLEEELPFSLTEDQRATIEQIDQDLARAQPMQRLLMGEVGSGKTVLALYAMLRAVEHGLQAALMAPTETLAEQHFATLQVLAPQALVPSVLLTGSTPAARRRDVLGKLADGSLQLLVGTHALIERDVGFRALGVVVVDEQHRFGVAQRTALAGGGKAAPGGTAEAPHVLHMTATPIPRTMWLTRYGDLDVSRLRTLPKGRMPIATHIASTAAERARAYERIREELRQGRQAFVVCPLVEESEQLQARAASSEYERLRSGELADFQLRLLHGQMRPREKQEAMQAFASGQADVLVATTVIEVGIDVPNATVMLIEDADRYGISQLHQLRGRVGRGSHPSLCLLFGPKSARRLQALTQHSDGFALAEIDLQLRGEGDLGEAGQSVRQSGQREMRVAMLPQDTRLLEAANACAKDLLARDPGLCEPEHVPLRDALGLIPA